MVKDEAMTAFCSKCREWPKHVTSGGRQISYCLPCEKDRWRARLATPEGKARHAAYCRTSKARRRAAEIAKATMDGRIAPKLANGQKWALRHEPRELMDPRYYGLDDPGESTADLS